MKSKNTELFAFGVTMLFNVNGFSPINIKLNNIITSPHQRPTTKIKYKDDIYPNIVSNDNVNLGKTTVDQVTLIGNKKIFEDNYKSNNNNWIESFNYDLENIKIVKRCEAFTEECGNNENEENISNLRPKTDTSHPFVDMIRNSASYIVNHRNSIVVCHIPGFFLECEGFPDLMDDIALMWSLGIKIVLVVGCRSQIEDRLLDFEGKRNSHLHKGISVPVNGIRITNANIMRIVEEESGYARFEVERQLNRSLKFHGGEDANGPSSLIGNVISGTFYEAEPVGIVDGLDYKLTGYPISAHSQKILNTIENKNVALLTSSAINRNGDPMNVNSESLASYIAAEIGASKLIYCSNNDMVLKDKAEKGIQNFRLKDAKSILKYYGIKMNEPFFFASIYIDNERENKSSKEVREQVVSNNFVTISTAAQNMLLKIGWAYLALRNGVERAHIVSPSDGALLVELFTAKEGSGTCIVRDDSEELHPDEFFHGDVGKKLNQFNDKNSEILPTISDNVDTFEDKKLSGRRYTLRTSFM